MHTAREKEIARPFDSGEIYPTKADKIKLD